MLAPEPSNRVGVEAPQPAGERRSWLAPARIIKVVASNHGHQSSSTRSTRPALRSRWAAPHHVSDSVTVADGIHDQRRAVSVSWPSSTFNAFPLLEFPNI